MNSISIDLTTNVVILLKRAEEDKVFQLLASLGSECEDLVD